MAHVIQQSDLDPKSEAQTEPAKQRVEDRLGKTKTKIRIGGTENVGNKKRKRADT